MNTNIAAKRILIYGDSFVFGVIPGGGGARYDAATRYTGVAQKILGNDYEIIEEGLRGRTVSGDNGFFPHRDGLSQFDGIIGSHFPLDLVIIGLGTNDLNSSRNLTPAEIVAVYPKYIERLSWWCSHLGFPKPKIGFIAPPFIDEPSSEKVFKNIFLGSGPKSLVLPKLIKDFAQKHQLLCFDASALVRPSPLDGVHLDIDNNALLGRALAQFIKKAL